MSVTMEVHGAVAVITLDRPQALNALDLPALQQLRRDLLQLRDREDLRVGVITATGERAFCVGADLKSTRSSSASYAQALFLGNDAAADAGLYIRLMDLSDLGRHTPLIAAVNGHCLGGGLELALQCDLRIASANASFGLPEAAVGSIPAVSGLHRLLRAIPSAAHLSDSDAQRLTELYWGVLRDTDDRIEGRQAFAEKRIPHYKGR